MGSGKRKRRQFERTFKIEAVKLSHQEGRSIAEVARNLGINETVLRRWRHELTAASGEPLIRKVDCVSLPVANLDEALTFYRDRLGHRLIWRTSTAVGLQLADSDAELVLHTESRPAAPEFRVNDVPDAVDRIIEAGGTLLSGPFEIQIGKCAVVADRWGNALVLTDLSKGLLQTDAEGNVIESRIV